MIVPATKSYVKFWNCSNLFCKEQHMKDGETLIDD